VRPFSRTQALFAGLRFAALLLASAASAQNPPQNPSQDPASDPLQTLHLSAKLVLLDAVAVDLKTTQPIPDLTPEDFILTEDKVPQSIAYLSVDRIPLSITLLFDTTDSVQPILDPLAAGASQILAHLRPEDEVAVLAFSSRTIPLQDFTLDRKLAAAAIKKASRTHTREGTFIHEDVFEATKYATQGNPDSRRVQVWLTDGTANLQDKATKDKIGKNAPAILHTQEEATDSLLRSGVTVSALIEQTPEIEAQSHLPDQAMRFGDVERYAAITGGPVVYSSPQAVATRLAILLDALRQRYTLGFKPLVDRPAGTLCRLHLELSPAFYASHPKIKSSQVFIRTRAAYFR
jgi:VWFA-related protein